MPLTGKFSTAVAFDTVVGFFGDFYFAHGIPFYVVGWFSHIRLLFSALAVSVLKQKVRSRGGLLSFSLSKKCILFLMQLSAPPPGRYFVSLSARRVPGSSLANAKYSFRRENVAERKP